MAELRCEWDPSNFSAQVTQTGDTRVIKVVGRGTCPQGGYSVTLEPGNRGFNPRPDVLTLQIVETPPGIGTTALTDTPVEKEFTVSDEIQSVNILQVGLIPVTKVE